MNTILIPVEAIETRIFPIRGKKVMLDKDLAELYKVETRTLIQSIKRNKDRFPEDFMFELSIAEIRHLRSQFVISKRGGLRYRPFVFTEQGIAMLSSVLKSERAILVNIQIMRTFSRLRQIIAGNEQLRLKLESMEKQYDEQFKVVFEALRRVMKETAEPPKEIGFKTK